LSPLRWARGRQQDQCPATSSSLRASAITCNRGIDVKRTQVGPAESGRRAPSWRGMSKDPRPPGAGSTAGAILTVNRARRHRERATDLDEWDPANVSPLVARLGTNVMPGHRRDPGPGGGAQRGYPSWVPGAASEKRGPLNRRSCSAPSVGHDGLSDTGAIPDCVHAFAEGGAHCREGLCVRRVHANHEAHRGFNPEQRNGPSTALTFTSRKSTPRRSKPIASRETWIRYRCPPSLDQGYSSESRQLQRYLPN
jgi:hypothetical protein